MSDSRIFICYRRTDATDRAHRLHDTLVTRFGKGEVFIDLDLPAGQDVRRYLTDKLNSCAVLLVVIGPTWLTITDESGESRIANEMDWVRLEIATALSHDVAVIPLLVQGARMPLARELPAEIDRLAGLNALQLSDGSNWKHNVNDLIATIEDLPASPPVRTRTRSGPASLVAWIARAARTHRMGTVAVAGLGALAIVLLHARSGDDSLTIYSSLPQREQQLPERISSSGSDHDLGVVKSKRTSDVEKAISLALADNGNKAGEFDVVYKKLDASDEHGASPPAVIQANARRAAADRHAAVYIGDFSSGASQESIPILSRAKLAQISPASTRVGLTEMDPTGDYDEPDRYYPPQPGYPHGFRNFIRIVPRDDVQAKALNAVMVRDGCSAIAMVDDDSPYGAALAKDIRLYTRRHTRMHFVFSESVGPFGSHTYVARLAKQLHADCFVYSGARNPNTVLIFKTMGRGLPRAQLYGTDGEVAASFYDPRQNGLPSTFDERVTVMVPPRSPDRYSRFVAEFNAKYHDAHPDPYAVYGYESMRLALEAIRTSKTGSREDIVAALGSATASAEDSFIGPYSIHDGDTDVGSYDMSKIHHGVLRPRPALPRRPRT